MFCRQFDRQESPTEKFKRLQLAYSKAFKAYQGTSKDFGRIMAKRKALRDIADRHKGELEAFLSEMSKDLSNDVSLK